jgi:CheY-like chemotaxis protein
VRQPPLVLIADDNEANRDILARRLDAHGYDLLMAADGEEALSCAREKLPDLILLDIMMPKMDGLEVCRHLKGDKSLLYPDHPSSPLGRIPRTSLRAWTLAPTNT